MLEFFFFPPLICLVNHINKGNTGSFSLVLSSVLRCLLTGFASFFEFLMQTSVSGQADGSLTSTCDGAASPSDRVFPSLVHVHTGRVYFYSKFSRFCSTFVFLYLSCENKILPSDAVFHLSSVVCASSADA